MMGLRSQRLDAFAVAEHHRAEMHRLRGEIALAETVEEITQLKAEMTGAAHEYETLLRETTNALITSSR